MNHLISSYRNARYFCRGSFGDKESNMRSIGAESGSLKRVGFNAASKQHLRVVVFILDLRLNVVLD
jgi:hypothetical protein